MKKTKRPVLWLSWYIGVMFGLVALESAFVTPHPEFAETQNVMMIGFACDATVAVIVAVYLSLLPASHRFHQSKLVRTGFVILAVIVTLLLITSVG
jgi:hypothetical protein